jgi:FixJ family two-component response regulator
MALAHNPTVLVIDDDASIRASIQGLLKSEGLRSDVLSRCIARLVKGGQWPDVIQLLVATTARSSGSR